MCLAINETLTNKYKEMKEPIIAYKCLLMWDGDIVSPIQDTPWHNGLNRSSRKDATLTSEEESSGRAMFGFHCCLDLKSAKNFDQSMLNYVGGRRFYIYKVKINPEDIVAVGHFQPSPASEPMYDCPNIVATKVELMEEVINERE